MNKKTFTWLRGVAGLLILLVLADFGVHYPAHFHIDGTFGFHAWFGLAVGVGVAGLAWGADRLFSREETYYD